MAKGLQKNKLKHDTMGFTALKGRNILVYVYHFISSYLLSPLEKEACRKPQAIFLVKYLNYRFRLQAVHYKYQQKRRDTKKCRDLSK